MQFHLELEENQRLPFLDTMTLDTITKTLTFRVLWCSVAAIFKILYQDASKFQRVTVHGNYIRDEREVKQLTKT